MKGDSISAGELNRLVEKGTLLKLVDVRTAFEFKSGHIPGTVNLPAAALSQAAGNFDQSVPVVLICAAGHRAKTCQDMIAGSGLKTLVLEGGTGAWRAEGFAIDHPAKAGIAPLRQAFFIAAMMIFVGLYLGQTMNPGWFILAGLPGVGLLIISVTGFCPMEWILAKAPWN